MRLEMKSTRYEILTHHKINSVYITFHCRRNKIKFRFWGGPMNTAHSAEVNQFCFDEINASANVSVHMIQFRVLFTLYFITESETSFLSK